MTFPIDITKTRLQIQGERASTIPSTTAANVPYRGMVRTAVGIGEDDLHDLSSLKMHTLILVPQNMSSLDLFCSIDS